MSKSNRAELLKTYLQLAAEQADLLVKENKDKLLGGDPLLPLKGGQMVFTDRETASLIRRIGCQVAAISFAEETALNVKTPATAASVPVIREESRSAALILQRLSPPVPMASLHREPRPRRSLVPAWLTHLLRPQAAYTQTGVPAE